MHRPDPTDTTAIDATRKAKAVQAQLDAKADADDVRWLMSSERGRRFLWRQMEQAGVFRQTFNTNALVMAFNEGWRKNGTQLLQLVHQESADQYPDMVKENTRA